MSLGESNDDFRDWCFVDSVGGIIQVYEGGMENSEILKPESKGNLPTGDGSSNDTPIPLKCSHVSPIHEDESSESVSDLKKYSYESDSSGATDTTEETFDEVMQRCKREVLKEVCHRKKDSSSSDISILDVKDDGAIREFQGSRALPVHYSPPNSVVNPSEMLQCVTAPRLPPKRRGIDRITQTPSFRCVEEFTIETESKSWRLYNTREVLFFQFGSCFAFFLIVLVTYYCEQESPAVALDNIQHNILACLGKQQLEALRGNITNGTMPLFICQNGTGDYREMIDKHLKTKDVKALIINMQNMLFANESADVSTLISEDVSDIDIKLVIRHMEYFEVLPKMLTRSAAKEVDNFVLPHVHMANENVVSQMHQAVKNLTILNEELRNHALILSAERNTSSNTEAKSLHTDPDGYEGENSNSVSALKEKVTDLLLENDALKTEVDKFKKAQILGNGSTVNNTKTNDHTNDDAHRKHDLKENSENMNVDSEDLSNLVKQINVLQNTLEDKFSDVKNLYNLIKDFSEHLNNQQPSLNDDEAESEWSWRKLKVNMKNFIEETHADVKQTINGYKDIDVAEVLGDYVEDSKKHAENTLNLVADYFKAAQKKTQEIMEEKIPNIDMESAVNGVWNVWGTLQNKWSYVKHKFDHLADNVQQKFKDKHEEKVQYTPETENYADNLSKDGKHTCNSDGITKEKWHNGNWFFKRAELREEERAEKVPINWYLCREMIRETERKWKSRRHGEL